MLIQQQDKNHVTVLGLMSGTSHDGLDLCICKFWKNTHWQYDILYTKHVPYEYDFKQSLITAFSKPIDEINALHVTFGEFLAHEAKVCIEESGIVTDLIASHGHTIFHKPHEGITVQIGDGQIIANVCKIPVVYDFRLQDVKMGGQGAPLVPVGDALLFSEYDYCLNLGGVCNISFSQQGKRLAGDISLCNMVLDNIALRVGKQYDTNGELASNGKIILELLESWNALAYYNSKMPKSIGREMYVQEFLNFVNEDEIVESDKLATFVEHIATQIGIVCKESLENNTHAKMLITGGGAYNKFLVKRIQYHSGNNITCIIPDNRLIENKEAMVFAFLGLLRTKNINNIWSSVTGATQDHCSGTLVYPVSN